MSTDIKSKTAFVRGKALSLGFQDVGFSEAKRLDNQASKLTDWLKEGSHGEMAYMENHFEKRVDPTLLVEGARTVISLSYNYYTESHQSDPEAPLLSKYAYGRDYHKVVKKKLLQLLQMIKEDLGVKIARAFVDSAPVLERAWAQKGGLGWIGKNTMLIHPKKGSYFFLSELIIDTELEYDQAIPDHCGRCRRCIDACPTDAIDKDGYVLQADKCISYATIEKKGAIPEYFRGKINNRVFGCDICIEVCPWNKFAREHKEPDFKPREVMMKMSKKDWYAMGEDRFEELFNGTAVRRTKYEGLKRNLEFLKS